MFPLAPIVATAAGAVTQNVIGAVANAITGPTPPASANGASFAHYLEQLAANTVDTLKSGEVAAIAGVMGETPVQKVVDTVLTAERQLHMAIALRDRAVNAYQEISRMAI
ncbi:MAG: flagellar hook-basal body complex protein FliE [Methylocystis sp.]|nr:flagellar hook-basal body complex protein FliE [Methylocystis sp.]